ncbi:MAG: hypothetical protein AB1782_13665 [Cyanobacteriota bacterium]
MITNISLSQPKVKKPEKVNTNNQNLSFGANKSEATQKKSSAKKGAIIVAAAALLALPILLAKAPVGKFKSLAALQDKLKIVLQEKVKPLLDKLMGKATSANAGLNVVR